MRSGRERRCDLVTVDGVVFFSQEKEEQILEANLLGTPEVSIGGSPIRVDTRKAIALLSYLAFEKGATRDTLANSFWSESSSERARASLRRTLSALRTAAGAEVLDVDRHQIAITDQATIDLWQFEDSIRATFDHGHDDTAVCAECLLRGQPGGGSANVWLRETS